MTTTDATFAREITPEYETVGKRRRLVGYTMWLDGEIVGFARTYSEAETTLDQLVYNLLSDGMHQTAVALDGDSDVDECAAEVVGMLVEVAQTETAHTNAPDCPCDECMRTSYAYLNTLAPMAADVNALVIRGDDPTRVSAVLAHREEIIFFTGEGCDAYHCAHPATHTLQTNSDAVGTYHVCCQHYPDIAGETCGCADTRQRCLLCGGDHSAEDCPRIHPIDATALLEEADVLLSQTASHPGPDCSCPDCTRAAERLIIDAFMTRLRFDAGVLCSFCGDEHADSACPQKRPLLAPRVCGNCGGQHSIQQCSDIRRLLFAA